MKQIKNGLFGFFTLLLFISNSYAQVKETMLHSPDQKIELIFSVKDHQLFYAVNYKGKAVIRPSMLGLTINNKVIGSAAVLQVTGKNTVNQTYAWRGVHSKAVYHANTAQISVKASSAGNNFSMEAQVFNNGVAFRYVLPGSAKAIVNNDLTEFTLPAGSVVWSQGDISNYEGKYQQQNIADVKTGQKVGPPLTIQLPGQLGYAAITEGGLTDFAGMSLMATGNGVFKAQLTGNTAKTGKIETAWRIIEVGADLNTLVNCDIIADVSPKPDAALFPKGFATDWVKPGKSTWSWLAGNGDVTFENMKKFSSWAGKLGIPYNLVDEGWAKWNDGGKDKWQLIKELVDYSAKQHVKIWVWKAYPDRNGVPGLKDAAARQKFFKQCKAAGVAGLKIDFFDEESQEVIDFYQAALKDAAKMHLMLDFHGANKPTGESRTWPNEMSREGIRGLENGTSWPAHNTTLPFTRYLAGHGDYTPLSFRDLVKGTTLTHQVACVAAFTSSFMCLAVNPEELIGSPAKDMVMSIPVVWDETVVLPQSKVGGLVLMARRSGKSWFLVALNGENKQTVKVDLSFLDKGNYRSTVMEDDPANAKNCIIKSFGPKHTTTLNLDLSAGGGYLNRFDQINN